MKNLSQLIFFLFVLALPGTILRAQNTFPSTGNAGVGTSSPSERFHIYRNQAATYTPLMLLEDALAGGYTQMAIKGTGRVYHIGVGNASETGFSLANKFYIWDQNAVAPRMVVDNSGNIGIGTATPANRLSIYSATASTSGLQFARLNNTATAGASNGKVLSLDASGNVILVSDAQGTNGWAFAGNTNTNPTTDYLGTTDAKDLVFRTNGLERFRILSGGNLRVGSGADNGKSIQVYGTGYFSSSIGIGTDAIGDPNYRLFVDLGIRTRKVKVDMDTWPDYVFQDSYQLPALKEVEEYLKVHKHLPEMISAEEVSKNGVDLGANQAALLKKIEELTLYLIDQEKSIQKMQATIAAQQKMLEEMMGKSN